MTFGFMGAPYHFQYVVDRILARDPLLLALVFLDDVTAHGRTWEQVWEQTMCAIRVLAESGLMINLRKCKFLVARAVVLGMEISYATCALGEKYLRKWLEVRLPRTLQELQSVVGKLAWGSIVVPEFKE